MTAAAAPAKAWAALALLAIGLVAMAALQARRPAPNADMVELVNSDPARLRPFLDASGKEVSIESFRGKTVILNLSAPWCVPCLQEMPSLDRLAGQLQDFAVVAVTKDPVGDSPSEAMFDKMGLKRLKLYLDPEGRLARQVGARGFPTTMIRPATLATKQALPLT